MSAHAIDIQKAASLARLKLTPDEAALYESQLGKILDYMDVLARYDLGSVEPTAHAMPVHNVMRRDESRPSFTQDQALANAPKSSHHQFQIPKVVE
ncbi:MAG: Asp-tRNA(Asn)/Glu-tRNA(Gln) amidotransferase subunit GatC [Verrucomicrobiaceae bacterium]|nr:Asp-tRNA(Asn)/Glu-tRNA(Gln) amidotransferase subunit GatC [Verrucomicrobiaceae bacterium]